MQKAMSALAPIATAKADSGKRSGLLHFKRCVIAYRFKILNASAADGRHSGRLCFSFRRYRPRRARTPDPPWWKHRLKFFTAIPLQRVPSLLTTMHRFLLRLPFWHWVISRENLHRRL
jgi:hypothetical protein